MMLSDKVIALIRTYVPLAIGALATWAAASAHLVIGPSTQAGLVAACVAVLSAGYYGAVRLLERRWPQLGVLLGVAAKPTYKPKG